MSCPKIQELIRKKVDEKCDFWRMFRLFSKTAGVLVVDEGNIRNGDNSG